MYVSWNGDTRTASWRLLAGAARLDARPGRDRRAHRLRDLARARRRRAYVAVQALDAAGAVIGTSTTIRG